VSTTRIGQGFDVHPFGDGGVLVLGGVELTTGPGAASGTPTPTP